MVHSFEPKLPFLSIVLGCKSKHLPPFLSHSLSSFPPLALKTATLSIIYSGPVAGTEKGTSQSSDSQLRRRGVQTPGERQGRKALSLFNESGKLQWTGHKKRVIKVSRDVKEEETGKASQAEGMGTAEKSMEVRRVEP